MGIVFLHLFTLFSWLLGFLILWKIRYPEKEKGWKAGEAVEEREISIIIPARNEAGRLPKLLESLAAEKNKPLEILVIDDGSEDKTPFIAVKGGAAVIDSGLKPDDWTGKSWACWQGASAAKGKYLMFLDADTFFLPGGLSRIAAQMENTGSAVSVQPYHIVRRPYEILSAFFSIIVTAGLNTFTAAGGRIEPSGMFGACFVCSRSDYFKTGGHRAVRHEIVEDLALGRVFKEKGIRLKLFGGKNSFAVRMYPEGIGTLVEGWTKNMASGAGIIMPAVLMISVLWLSGATIAVTNCIWAAASGAPENLIIPFFTLFLYACQIFWMLFRIGNFAFPGTLVFPLPLLFFHCVFFRSLFRTMVRKKFVWKGREIHMRAD